MSTRSLTLAAVCFSLLTIAPGFAGTPSAAKPPPSTPAPASSGDAAAKHAKRTACLKEAKVKKLVGAARTSFVKTCAAAP